MSDVSTRARALLAAATPGEWTLSEHFLAALAGEVEEHEAGRRFSKVVVRETYTDAEVGRHVAALTAENARLRAALEKYGQHFPLMCHAPNGGPCNCGFDAALRGEEQP